MFLDEMPSTESSLCLDSLATIRGTESYQRHQSAAFQALLLHHSSFVRFFFFFLCCFPCFASGPFQALCASSNTSHKAWKAHNSKHSDKTSRMSTPHSLLFNHFLFPSSKTKQKTAQTEPKAAVIPLQPRVEFVPALLCITTQHHLVVGLLPLASRVSRHNLSDSSSTRSKQQHTTTAHLFSRSLSLSLCVFPHHLLTQCVVVICLPSPHTHPIFVCERERLCVCGQDARPLHIALCPFS